MPVNNEYFDSIYKEKKYRMNALVIMNRNAGTGKRRVTEAEVTEAFVRHGIRPDIRLVEGEEIARVVSEANGVDVVVSAGGDGTLLTVATELVRKGSTPLGILPLGTVNHLARNLGIPLDPEGVAKTLAEGQILEMDAAEVNGRLFLTDSMIGMLTYVLFAAEQRRGSKLVRLGVLLSMLARVFRRMPIARVEVRAGGRAFRAHTPLLVITNNRMELDGRNFLSRNRLDAGKLCLYLPRATRRRDLVRLLFLALIDRLDLARELTIEEHESISIHMRKTAEMVMVDGEYYPLDTPLRFRILPRALKIYVPRGEPPAQAQGA